MSESLKLFQISCFYQMATLLKYGVRKGENGISRMSVGGPTYMLTPRFTGEGTQNVAVSFPKVQNPYVQVIIFTLMSLFRPSNPQSSIHGGLAHSRPGGQQLPPVPSRQKTGETLRGGSYDQELSTLRKQDPLIVSIFAWFDHVTCFFDGDRGERRGFEGRMVIYERCVTLSIYFFHSSSPMASITPRY